MPAYLPRITDQELATRLQVMGAVLIEGPKACGKTATASQVAKTIIRFDEDPVARSQVTLDPPSALQRRAPDPVRRVAARTRHLEPRTPPG